MSSIDRGNSDRHSQRKPGHGHEGGKRVQPSVRKTVPPVPPPAAMSLPDEERNGRASHRSRLAGKQRTQPLPVVAQGERPISPENINTVGELPSLTESFRDRAPRSRPLPRKQKRLLRRLLRAIFLAPQRLRNLAVVLFTNWQFLICSSFLLCISSSTLAIAFIFQLPGLPNCPEVFWPLASASMRFECARIAASKQTAKDLLSAIALVDGLPSDHAMRGEANRLIELWSQEVLKLADELFHAGDLDEAISAARQIPAKATAHRLIEERVKVWQTTWQTAEDIYRKAEAAMRKRDWREAFQLAVGLLDVDNRYWQTTRYDDLNQRINTARADGEKLYKAEWLADAGDVSSLVQAIKLAEEIQPNSYVYALAQVKIQSFGRKMLDLAQRALDRRNLQEALSIVNRIPARAKIESEKKDLTVLANAQSQAWLDTVPGLEAAISQAQRIAPGRPLRQKAQGLIVRWQYEIEGLAQLERARMLAQNGTPEAFYAAISSASQISSNNPRWQQAQTQISQWRTEIQTIEDRPILDQAEQLAVAGDVNALQAAVDQASQIASGRSLYQEAQGKVRQWTRQIQQIQDQPYLEQARSLAFTGALREAIKVAAQIGPGRVLYDEAQADITKWRNQIQADVDRAQAQMAQAQAQSRLQEARQMASIGNPTALGNAIQTANQIPGSGAIQAEVNALIDEWSWQLLQLAKDQANSLNMAGAIATAQKIPSRAAAYREAQAQLQVWQQSGL